MSKYFSKKIKERRKELGLTLKNVGEALNCDKSYVHCLETRKVAQPSARNVFRLADILEICPRYLIDDNITTPEQSATLSNTKISLLNDRNKSIIRSIVNALYANQGKEK